MHHRLRHRTHPSALAVAAVLGTAATARSPLPPTNRLGYSRAGPKPARRATTPGPPRGRTSPLGRLRVRLDHRLLLLLAGQPVRLPVQHLLPRRDYGYRNYKDAGSFSAN